MTTPRSCPQSGGPAGSSRATSTEAPGETFTLTETRPASGVFSGTVTLENGSTPDPGDGYLQVVNGDRIVAAYFDEDDGAGGSGTRYATAVVDEDPPIISRVAATLIEPRRATIVWTTDEPADSSVTLGASVPLTETVSDDLPGVGHSVELRGLQPGVTCLYQVRSVDEHGFERIDDNGGLYYSLNGSLVFTQSGDYRLVALDSTTGSVIWSYSLPGVLPIHGATVGGGKVFMPQAGAGGAGYMTALDERTGAWLWDRSIGVFQAGHVPLFPQGTLSKLVHTWIFDGVPSGFSHKLHIEAQKLEAGDDNFVFYYSTDGINWTAISGGTVTQAFVDQVIEPVFGSGSLSGRIYIQVRDSDLNNSGAQLNTLLVDHLTIETVP